MIFQLLLLKQNSYMKVYTPKVLPTLVSVSLKEQLLLCECLSHFHLGRWQESPLFDCKVNKSLVFHVINLTFIYFFNHFVRMSFDKWLTVRPRTAHCNLKDSLLSPYLTVGCSCGTAVVKLRCNGSILSITFALCLI